MKKTIMLMACMIAATAVQAGKPMTSSIQAEIKKAAEIEYPDDYSMQAYQIKNETESFEKFQAMEKPDHDKQKIYAHCAAGCFMYPPCKEYLSRVL